MMRRSVALSIDWDFFPWMPKFRTVKLERRDGSTITVSGYLLFDWAHGEGWGRSNEMGSFLWEQRFAGLWRMGLDAQEIVAIREDRGCADPSRFFELVAARHKLAPQLWTADSHAHAYEFAARTGPRHLISFDAHHDLVYSSERRRDEVAREVCSCESWLYHALRTRIVDTATIVYPDWLGLDEWRLFDRRRLGRYVNARVEGVTYSDWLSGNVRFEQESSDETPVFIARSGSWTPPWLDDQLVAFARMFSERRWVNVDAWRPRKWDRDAVVERSTSEAELFARALEMVEART